MGLAKAEAGTGDERDILMGMILCNGIVTFRSTTPLFGVYEIDNTMTIFEDKICIIFHNNVCSNNFFTFNMVGLAMAWPLDTHDTVILLIVFLLYH